MRTPDTVGAIRRIATPFISQELAAFRAAERQPTASTVGQSYVGSVATWASDGDSSDDECSHDRRPTFEACLSAVVAAAERMVALAREQRSMAAAIAYDECVDIITAAVDHMEVIGSRGVQDENVRDACRAMRHIRELLRPSPAVRRTLRF
jgi:hypothetical protein